MNATALVGATETAVLVLVPEAEPAVAEHRAHLDMAASWGVPAHVSVVYPFVPPADVDDDVLARLRAAAGTVPAFDCVFHRTDWFGDDVLWLAPDPGAPFEELVRALVAEFPAHLPYGGIYDEPIPHLTVGELRLGSTEKLAAAEKAVRAHLPIRAHVDRVVLLAGRPGATHGGRSPTSPSAEHARAPSALRSPLPDFAPSATRGADGGRRTLTAGRPSRWPCSWTCTTRSTA